MRAQQQKTTSASGVVAARASTSATRETTTDEKEKAGEKRRKQGQRRRRNTLERAGRDDGIPTRTRTAVDGGRFSVRYTQLERGDESRRGERSECRQHVNPLSQKFCKPSETPSWDVIFKDISKPLTIDVGCGGGRFPLAMAKRFRERNFLGVDVREALVERGEKWGEFAEVSENVAFAAGNCTVSLKPWLEDYNENNKDNKRGKVELVCVQFPDPHFKRKHWKRRVVQKEMVEALASGLEEGARVFLQSDVKEVAEDMRDKFEKFGNGKFVVGDSLRLENTRLFGQMRRPVGWEGEEHEFVQHGIKRMVEENPLGVPTEREVQTISEGQPCFDALCEIALHIVRISRSNKNFYHHHPNLRLYRSRVSLNLTLPFGTVVLLFDIGVEEDDVAVFTILFRLNMSEASRIMSLYFDEEGTADADFAGPPRADKFPAFNAARSIASATTCG